MRISDEDIMDALAKSADNLDIDFRERMVPEEMIQEILELRLQARAEVALMSEIRRHNVWIVLIRIPLCAGSILVFVSFVLWLTTFEYIRAVCALFEFANATCSQANSCLFRVAVQLPGEQFAVFHPAWTLPAEEAWGTAIFDRNGPFRCCNSPKFYISGGTAATSSIAVGAGTPCCDFVDENRSLYCDNFGDSQRQPNPVADCPASPWACGVKTEIVDGETLVKELQVWVDPPSLELFLAALACLSAAGLVRMSPQILRVLGRCLERCNSKFHIFAHTTGRRLRRLRKGLRTSRLSTSSSAESDNGPDPRRSSRKSRPKAAAKAVKDSERRSVQSEESEDVTSEAKVPVRAVWVQPTRAGPQMVGEAVGETTVEASPVVTVAVRAAKVQPEGPREAARQEPVRLEEILRPIITPASRLRRDNSRDRDLQAPRPAARPKHRQLPRRVMANAPQPTVSPVKVMQMSQTQEQWMATSAQLRQMTSTQDPPPDLSAQGRRSRPRGRSGPQAPRQTHI